MSILDSITGNGVLTTGIVGASASSFLLSVHAGCIITGLMALVAVITYSSKAQGVFRKLLGGFAEVPAWPRFVTLGVAALVAGYHGGGHAVLTLAFLLGAFDGNTFDALY